MATHTLSDRLGKMIDSYVERCGFDSRQMDLSSITPLSVAGCGRLQLGVTHWVVTVAVGN